MKLISRFFEFFCLFQVASGANSTDAESERDLLQSVMLVGNSWDGTATLLHSTNYSVLRVVNLVPDLKERISTSMSIWNPIDFVVSKFKQIQDANGHDQLVNDLYTSPAGDSIICSRPSLGDVASVNIETGTLNWRFTVPGNRADNMALSPDGTKVYVSASKSKSVCVLDINTGKLLGVIKPTGDSPQENLIKNGTEIWNMAIGNVASTFSFVDDTQPWLDFTKGDRHITVADADTLQIIKTINIRSLLDKAGYQSFSNAIRQATFSKDWSRLYFQVSYFNGFFEYDVSKDSITRQFSLPSNPLLNPDKSLFEDDVRHQGLALSADGSRMCVAGTMDGYITIVDTESLTHTTLVSAERPYGETVNGDHCIVAEPGANLVTAISFKAGLKVFSVEVGNHSTRIHLGKIKIN